MVSDWRRASEACAGVLADAWESRHAYLEERKASAGNLSLVHDLTMKKGVGKPYANWSRAGAVFLMSPRQGETSQHGV